ncbi:MAG: 50S ribosomal protein L4 [Actinomycetota bacterium]|nr:50S ribosomal protein L4 [Actinomycetota bacterium]
MADGGQAPLFGPDGTEQGSVSLDPRVFGIEPNIPVMHQVVTAQLAGARSGAASTKTRSEVRGGGRKPWRQKMTGRARHGSIRSPIWTGGGVVFGPHPRDFSQRTPKKMKRLALRSALSARASEGEVRVLERFDWSAPRTKAAQALLGSMGATGKVLVVVGSGDDIALRSFRNLPRVLVARVDQLNTYDVLWADTVIFTQDTLAAAGGAGGYEVSERDFVKEDGGREEGGGGE